MHLHIINLILSGKRKGNLKYDYVSPNFHDLHQWGNIHTLENNTTLESHLNPTVWIWWIIPLDTVAPWFYMSLSRKYSYTIFNAHSVYTIFIFCTYFSLFFFLICSSLTNDIINISVRYRQKYHFSPSTCQDYF